MSSYLVFDIETVIDPELPIAQSPEVQKLPAPPHHQTVVIGALLLSGPQLTPKRLGIIGRDNTDEEVILREFVDLMEKHRPTLVSYNGRSFDLPVITARCLRHGIPFPSYYKSRDMRYRFTEAGHFDIMDYMADFGASKPARLDIMAKLCGMPGKVGVDGKDVGPLVHQGRIAEVRDYCLCDVVQTAGVFLRVELLRGMLSRETYITAMRSLLQSIEDDARVQPLWEPMNRERLLLGEPLHLPTESTEDSTNPEAAASAEAEEPAPL